MQITVSGKQVDLSEALQTRVSTQLAEVTRKYFSHAVEAHVTFGRARSFFTCDINLHAGRGLTLRGEGEAADANLAFDAAAEHIAKRLRRYRRRVNEHARDLTNRERGEAARQYVLRQETDADAAGEAPGGAPGDEAGDAARDAAGDAGKKVNGASADALARVITEHPAEILLLTLDEALMHMDLENQPVLMFRHRDSGKMNVVYRRVDGTIGWIDPAA
jgi:ribosomal subunit interface protein